MLTRTGAGTAVGGLAVYVLGVWLGYVVLAGIGAAALLLVASSAAVVAVRPQLDVTRSLRPSRAPAGEAVVVHLEVRNPGQRPVPRLTVTDHVAGHALAARLPRVAPGEAARVDYELPRLGRGIYDVGPLDLRRSDLFGLASSVRDVGGQLPLHIHPRVHALSRLPATRTRSLEGATVDSGPRGTATFHAVREYVVGDDIRHIHWRSTARTGQLMVREYLDTDLPDLTLVLDNRAGLMTPDRFEDAVEATASLAVATIAGGHPLRLRVTAGPDLSHAAGATSVDEVLDELAGVTQQALDGDPWMALTDPSSRSQVGIVVTGALADADLRGVAADLGGFAAATAVQFTDGGSSTDLGAVLLLRCRTIDEFVETWNTTS